ncbi:MAG: metallophosphatase family protein [Candidatus Omnitrophica bacterium]|nr:metallophosphatase family protein [Candidatus Omnitrophota bacterium]MBU2044611.1 metallophosphatase family protein [Candidatus Omnitrophota bacterium]MBU2250837.1 metallophosphatase family protein [Candidatus Omnitrophota bacterium]MBU2265499.1 metallophosphatase family protein [Candidatus Omnitrophota bacterium]
MKYAVFSDVHGNLEAFKAALDVYYREKIDHYIFLGDIVGYGAEPKECLSRLKELKAVVVAGNHDWAVSGKFPANNLNIYAREAIFWTQKRLKKEDLAYLDKFSLTVEEEDFICVHGSLKSPHEFDYIFDLDDASVNFNFLQKKICFIGHTHRPGIYCQGNDKISYIEQPEIRLEPGKRYIVNVGSVGQPRDGDPRASFCIYDDEAESLQIIRVGYDVAKSASAILNQGLPAMLANRLYDGR